MSKKTDKLAAAAKLAAEKAAKEVQAAEDKLAAAKAAEEAAALVSPADKALERAFVRGTLPEEDRRAGELVPTGNSNTPNAGPPNELPRATVASSAPPTIPPGGPPRTGEPVIPVVDRDFITTSGGHSLPDPIPGPLTDSQGFVRSDPLTDEFRRAATPAIPQPLSDTVAREPALPPSVVTPQPIVPRSEHAKLTAEDAVEFQRIPNDAINSVFEREDGNKVDSLGHVFPSQVPAPRVSVRPKAVTQVKNETTGVFEFFDGAGNRIE